MTEFELIARYFARPTRRALLGIGDDCALIAPPAGRTLAVSTDMLVAGRHFFDDADPGALGWKTLAVNLSDLAAMGARPLGFTLALALPSVDPIWLAAFSEGLFDCASRFDCELVGGDTTRGPLNLCVTVFGEVDAATVLRRDRAVPGDDLWISGSPGRAAHALQRAVAQRDDPSVALSSSLRDALDRPVPRVALGLALGGVAHAAIDVSDGLAQDLDHLLAASGVGAVVDREALPVGAELRSLVSSERHRLMLAGGDDYELCFTAPAEARDAVVAAGRSAAVPVTRFGAIVARDGGPAITGPWVAADAPRGFDHFA